MRVSRGCVKIPGGLGVTQRPARRGDPARLARHGSPLKTHRGFRTPAIVVTASFAVWGALLPAKAGGLERAALAVAGVGGALLVGLVVFAVKVLKAPLRQRDEAREALGTRTPDTDKPLEIFNKRLRGGGVLLQRLEAIVVDGGDWNEDAGRWEQETRADIEALAGPGECALFVKSAPSMRDFMRQRLEYLRDRLIPRARSSLARLTVVAWCLLLRFAPRELEHPQQAIHRSRL